MTQKSVGGIVLCGGNSSRMGLAKATLPFGPESMLQRVLRLLGEVVQPLVVVAAPSQELSDLPAGTIIARDEREGRGPLEGLLAGLKAISAYANAAYVSSCDVPLLKPDFVRKVIEYLGEQQACVPVDNRFHHSLAAVYRTNVIPVIEELLAADRMRPMFLFDKVQTNRISVETLSEVDPQLSTLLNLNRPEQYLDALRQAGFEPPPAIVDRFVGQHHFRHR